MVICEFKDSYKKYDRPLKLDEYILNYHNKKIKIYSSKYLNIHINDSKRLQMNEQEQIIRYDDGKDIYELKFHDSINNNILFLNKLYHYDTIYSIFF